MRCPKCGHSFLTSRSRNQQALLHKLLRAWSNASGIPFDRAKMRLKYEGGEWVEVPIEPDKLRQFIAHPPFPGDYLEVGKRMYQQQEVTTLVFVKSEAAYSKEEETALIDYVVGRCAEIDADIAFMEGM